MRHLFPFAPNLNSYRLLLLLAAASAVSLASTGCGDDSAAADTSGSGAGGVAATTGGGGVGGTGGEGGAAPALDPTSFRMTGAMPVKIRYHQSTLLPDGRVLVSGGASTIDGLPRLEAQTFDPATETFAPTPPMNDRRAFHSSTLLPSGQVLVVGGGRGNIIGLASGLDTTASAELFDPATNTFTPTGSMATARANHRAVLLPDGRVLIAGGGTDEEGSPCNAAYPDCFIAKTTPTAELYDPATGAFTETAPMSSPRIAFTLTLLADGRVLALAGADDDDTLATSEIFDPATGTWTAGPSIETDRLYHSTVLLGDGRTLLVAGKDGNVGPLQDSQLLDESASAWSAGPAYGETLTAIAATTLESGNAIFAGGYNQKKQDNTASARIFDAATSSFVQIGGLIEARALATATLLADGRVLVCGGALGGPSTNSCEIGE